MRQRNARFRRENRNVDIGNKRQTEKSIFQSGIMDYETFQAENQRKVNLLLNKFLWFSILVGPLLMLAIRGGIFHSVTYQTCIIVSLLQALTQVQEQTLGFAVKLIAISLTLLACASWMGSSLLLYTQDIFTHFALLR